MLFQAGGEKKKKNAHIFLGCIGIAYCTVLSVIAIIIAYSLLLHFLKKNKKTKQTHSSMHELCIDATLGQMKSHSSMHQWNWLGEGIPVLLYKFVYTQATFICVHLSLRFLLFIYLFFPPNTNVLLTDTVRAGIFPRIMTEARRQIKCTREYLLVGVKEWQDY